MCWFRGLFFWPLVGVAALLGLSANQTHEFKPAGIRDEAMEILRLRYARGEITQEEFERIKQSL